MHAIEFPLHEILKERAAWSMGNSELPYVGVVIDGSYIFDVLDVTHAIKEGECYSCGGDVLPQNEHDKPHFKHF